MRAAAKVLRQQMIAAQPPPPHSLCSPPCIDTAPFPRAPASSLPRPPLVAGLLRSEWSLKKRPHRNLDRSDDEPHPNLPMYAPALAVMTITGLFGPTPTLFLMKPLCYQPQTNWPT